MLWLFTLALAHEVVVFGDSWAEGGGDALGRVLLRHGRADLSVDNVGVGGTTAAGWNDTAPTALSDAVSANPDAEVVWLSILGNDTFALHNQRQSAQAAGINEAELRELLGHLTAVHPEIAIVMIGYDFVNFEQSAECVLAAAVYFPELWDRGQLTTAHVNDIFRRDVGEVIARVAADVPQLHHVPVWGTLQAADGIPGAPVDGLPSPARFMSDCIHPTQQGYELVHEVAWDEAFALTAPAARATAPTSICEDASLTLTSTSSPAHAWRWTMDGVEIGTDASVTMPAPPPGTHTARLWVRHGAWSDAVDLPVEVTARPVPEISPDTRVCEGDRVLLEASGGDISWTDGTGTLDGGAQLEVHPSQTTTYYATVSAGPGCDEVVSVEVVVDPSPTGTLSISPTVTASAPVEARVLDTSDRVRVSWDADGGTVAGSGTTVFVRWDTPGDKTLTATLSSEEGCSTEVTTTVEVTAAPWDTDADPGSDPDAPTSIEGCTCDGGPRGGPWLGLLALLGLRRQSGRA